MDIEIFEPVFKDRPEINLDKFKRDLDSYYLPYLDKLLKLPKPAIVGVSAIQGAGKTTQGEILEILLKNAGLNSVSLSIDDHYITHKELCDLRERDPRFIRRGVTNDIALAVRDLQALMNWSAVTLVSGYDKGAYLGDGERFRWINLVPDLVVKGIVKNNSFHLTAAKYKDTVLALPGNMGGDLPFEDKLEERVYTLTADNFDGLPKEKFPNGWRLVTCKPDFVFYDGWMLGARSVSDESVFDQNLAALETPEAKQFAKDVNKKLLEYEELWKMINFLNILYVPHYEMALEWRENAEKPLREKGGGMTPEQIKEFVHYFWRSVHPAIQIKNLAHDENHTNQVVVIGDDHSVLEVISPREALSKYP